jgi:allene oxide cyclase
MHALTFLGFAPATLLAGSALGSESMLLVERAVSDTNVDLGAKGDSLGDLLVFANPIYDSANRVEVGRDQGYCVRVAVGKSWGCFWTLILKDGQITSEGPFYDSGDSLMAITGGTGNYVGAQGSVRVHPGDARQSSFDFRYELRLGR